MIERKNVFIEGAMYPGTQRLRTVKGALYLDKEPIPIVVGAVDGRVVGRASKLRRDLDTGNVSLELYIHPSFDLNLDEFDARVVLLDAMKSVDKDDESVIIINSARLAEVCLIWEGSE